MAAALIYGHVRIGQVDAVRAAAPKVKVGVVQPNIAFDKKNLSRADQVKNLQACSARAEAEGAELLVWTESSFPFAVARDQKTDVDEKFQGRIRRGFTAPLFMGAITVDPKGGEETYPFNSALMLEPDGTFTGRFDKMYLLMFGEYIPGLETFPFLRKMMPRAAGHFAHGKEVVTFPFRRATDPPDGPAWRLGPLICYEDILPAFGRNVGKLHPHLLVNITNDAWFGDSAEPWEHLQLAIYRSVEQRTDMVRAVNTGVSAYIDAAGRPVKLGYSMDPATQDLPAGRTTCGVTTGAKTDYFVAELALVEGGHTVYAVVGDAFGIALALLTLWLWLVRPWLRARRGAAAAPSRPRRELMDRAARRAAGAFYTPPALIAELVAGLPIADAVVDGVPRGPGGAPLRVVDPACGDGRLLAAMLDALAARVTAAGQKVSRARLAAACLVGVERDAAAAAQARAALPGAVIHDAEALVSGVLADGAADLIIGNPPYLGSSELRAADPALHAALRARLAVCAHGEWDLSAAFMARVLDWLAPAGRAALVVPSRWLTSRAAAPLRELLARRGAVAEVLHHGAAQHFAGATTYVCVVGLVAQPSARLGFSRDGARWTVDTTTLGAAPWTTALAGPELAALAGAGPRLGDVARVAKGAGSNADPVFLVPKGSAIARRSAGARAAVRGRDVGAFAAAHAVDALLPYDADGRLVPFEVLPPAVQAHLRAHQARLAARERGRFAARWHAWGRPQNLRWLRDPAPKLIVPDAAAHGRAALDREGRLAMDSAYAVRPVDDAVPLGLLLAVLNAPIVATWLGATGMPLRGGYFRMKTDALASLPVPRADTRAARAVASRALALDPDDAGACAELAARTMALYARLTGRQASATRLSPRSV